MISNWKLCYDFVCCVEATSQQEAIDKVSNIALSRKGARFIKIVGVTPGKQEWIDENNPLDTDEEFYRKQIDALQARLEAKRKLEI